jgi:putative membrane protein
MSSLHFDSLSPFPRSAKSNHQIPERDLQVYFSAERTLLSWVRTGLAMMGFGFVLAVSGGGSLWAGTSLVLLGVVLNFYAAGAHSRFVARFEQGDSTPQHSRFGIAIASALAAIGLAMAVYLIAH